jgi:hypothetical protein
MLPRCRFPSAQAHVSGLLPCSSTIPLVNLQAALPFRRAACAPVPLDTLPRGDALLVARVIAQAFSENEPMTRHIQLPSKFSAELFTAIHSDPFGDEHFGPWTKENLFYWIVRLFLLCCSWSVTNDMGRISPNQSIISHSLAVLDDFGKVIGGSLSSVAHLDELRMPLRKGDIFLDATNSFFAPINRLLVEQEIAALEYLAAHVPDFNAALARGRVGHFAMIARSPEMTSEHVCELAFRSIEHLAALGHQYLVTAAASEWTGAIMELVGAVAVHYAPYRLRPVLPASSEGCPEVVSSPCGFLAAKDSGCMFYVLRLAD